jgi:hypothetical protein
MTRRRIAGVACGDPLDEPFDRRRAGRFASVLIEWLRAATSSPSASRRNRDQPSGWDQHVLDLLRSEATVPNERDSVALSHSFVLNTFASFPRSFCKMVVTSDPN